MGDKIKAGKGQSGLCEIIIRGGWRRPATREGKKYKKPDRRERKGGKQARLLNWERKLRAPGGARG